MTGLAAPFLKRGMVDRIQKTLLRCAMRIMTTETGAARGIHVVMNITEARGLAVVT